jgi:1-acyl-sn-glycerol-3-phosphate acyltransferase
VIRSTLIFLVRLITGANVLWRGGKTAPKAVRLYFANHGSHLDFVTLWAALPKELRDRTRPVAARDYWGKTAFSRWVAVSIFNALLIRREGITKDDNPIGQMTAALNAGESLIFFPEGTRSSDGEMRDFKAGLYHLACKVPEMEMVPAFLQNLNRILPKGHLLPIPLISTVVIGQPIRLLEGESKADFLKRARTAVTELCPTSQTQDAETVKSGIEVY